MVAKVRFEDALDMTEMYKVNPPAPSTELDTTRNRRDVNKVWVDARGVNVTKDAISHQNRFGKFNMLMLLLNASLITGMAFEIFSVAYLVPANACDLKTTNSQQGLMASVPLAGIIATSHFWGYLADTRGRKKILSLSMTLGFIAGFLATFSPNWIVFSILKFMSSSASVYLASTGLMAILTIPVLSLTFSYYIPFLDIHFNSWRLLNAIYTLPCVFGAVGVFFTFESPKYLLSIGEDEKALHVLQGMFVINNGKPREEFQVQSLTLDETSAQHVKGLWASIVSQTMPLLRPPLLKNTLLLSVLFVVIYFCLNPYSVWLPYVADGFMRSIQNGDEGLTFCQMMRSSQNVTMSENSDCSLDKFGMVMVFAVSLFLAVMNIILSLIINITGRKRTLITIQIVSGISALSINFSSEWMVSGPLFIAFMAAITNFGLLSSFCVDIFPTYVKAMAVCLTLMVGRGSSIFGINLLKNLLVNNCEASFYLYGGLTFAGGLIAFFLPSEAKIAINNHKLKTMVT